MEEAWESAAVSIAEANIDAVELTLDENIGMNIDPADRFYAASYFRRQEARTRLYWALALFSAGIVSTFFASETSLADSLRSYFMIDGSMSKFRIFSAILLFSGVIFFIYAFYKNTVSAASSNAELVADASIQRMTSKQRKELSAKEIEIAAQEEKKYSALREERRLRSQAIEQTKSLRANDNSIASDWKEFLLSSRIRLLENQERLGQRSRSNLVWGIMLSTLTIASVGIIIWTGQGRAPAVSWVELFSNNLSRITLVLVLQLLAFFFLTNFIKTELVIERNKRELTDIELKMSSVLLLAEYGDSHSSMANHFATALNAYSDHSSNDEKESDLSKQLLKLLANHKNK